MDLDLRDKFLKQWAKYFGNAELPIVFYYKNIKEPREIPEAKDYHCIICDLKSVRKGNNLYLDLYTRGCHHGKLYASYTNQSNEDATCGVEDHDQEDLLKKSPGIAKEMLERSPAFKAITRYIVFKRWDKIEEDDNPEVVVFFARPDVLSGLFTLANFDTSEPPIAIIPAATGCGSIISYPYLQKDSEVPLPVVGMLDHSARPCVEPSVLTFSVPMKKMKTMIMNMDQSFLTTKSWNKIKRRIR